MKTYDQRTKDILFKADVLKKKRRKVTSIAVALSCCLVLVVGLMLIQNRPYPPGSYEPLIKKLSALTDNNPAYGNTGVYTYGYSAMTGAAPESAPAVDSATNGSSYEEITDNQVQRVTESDLIKRSDRYIYYLRNNVLAIYSIEGEASREVGSYTLGSTGFDGYDMKSYNNFEMYLSEDCATITVITSCYRKSGDQNYLYLVNLDVSDPANISRRNHCFISGSYNTSRLMDEDLYVISKFYVAYNVDYEQKGDFLPGYGTPENMTYLPMEDICIPKEPDKAMYTVVTRMDHKTLEVEDSYALVSPTDAIYVSQENIYLADTYTKKGLGGFSYRSVTDITRIHYSGGSLENMGTFTVEGSVGDQYSMDEYDGMLRVVTTTSKSIGATRTQDGYTYFNRLSNTMNADLYCIDLSNHKVISHVKSFAPEGESVQSVRFDGAHAYVCTSIVLSDPVFFFDLSDPKNITCKDTGTIDGYSMSLVDFSEGFLMGIGYGNSFRTLKIEIYREGENAVESHCVYELSNCSFATDYKAYYIDRENQLIGLGITSQKTDLYILLQFDGYELVELLRCELPGDNSDKRAVYIDGYLYMFGDEFIVEKIA